MWHVFSPWYHCGSGTYYSVVTYDDITVAVSVARVASVLTPDENITQRWDGVEQRRIWQHSCQLLGTMGSSWEEEYLVWMMGTLWNSYITYYSRGVTVSLEKGYFAVVMQWYNEHQSKFFTPWSVWLIVPYRPIIIIDAMWVNEHIWELKVKILVIKGKARKCDVVFMF